MVNSSAEGLIEKLGMTKRELKNASKTFTKEELAKLLNYNVDSFFGKLRFSWATYKVHHINDAEQLVFMEITSGNYTPSLENLAEIKDRKQIEYRPKYNVKE